MKKLSLLLVCLLLFGCSNSTNYYREAESVDSRNIIADINSNKDKAIIICSDGIYNYGKILKGATFDGSNYTIEEGPNLSLIPNNKAQAFRAELSDNYYDISIPENFITSGRNYYKVFIYDNNDKYIGIIYSYNTIKEPY